LAKLAASSSSSSSMNLAKKQQKIGWIDQDDQMDAEKQQVN